MATVLSTLYPPLINDFMPAFLVNEDATIQFSISAYNTTDTINRLHISLVEQYTNLKAIKNKALSSSDGAGNSPTILNNIWIVDMNNSNYISYDSLTKIYTLTIPREILKNKNSEGNETLWSPNGYYKLQLRFDESKDAIGENYLIQKRNKFSEWSSVCLLKAIPNVEIALSKFDIDDNQIEIPSFNAGVIPIIGEVIFKNNLSGTKAETLHSYNITLYNKNDVEDILDSSGEIYTAGQVDLNRIYWLAGAENADPANKYVVKINITTKNQYTTYKIYNLEIFNYDPTPFEVEWDFKRTNLDQYNITTDNKIITEEDGIVECTLRTKTSMPPGYLYIKRASNLDNFKKWELISCTKHSMSGNIIQTFFDTTVGSLVQYKYSAQYQLTTEAFTRIVKSPDIVYPNFYDMLLSRDGKQLAIRYKESISSLKPVVNRQKVDTLGGKYPKFVENAQMNYKQFSISGLIDAESDYNRKFLDDRDYTYEYQLQDGDTILGPMNVYDIEMNGKYEIRNDTIADEEYAYTNTNNSKKIRSHQNTVHDLYPKDNWWWERKFREEAIKWLNDGEPKLFRSMPEGNMTVMLTDISLTPEPTLGRRLYNFSATMYEIENGYSIETLESLGIINIVNEKEEATSDGEIAPIDTITKTTIGQMFSQELRTNGATPPSAIIINRRFNASMDDGNCGIVGFDYNHTNIGDWYNYIVYDKNSALGKKYIMVPDTIVLTDLQINFESPPTWWKFVGNDIISIDKNKPTESDISAVKALGYKIQLTLETGENGPVKTVNIFVGEKGFYQAPSNLRIIGLNIFGGSETINNGESPVIQPAIATINYKIEYQITYNTSSLPSSTKSQGNIVGQLYGVWTPDTYVSQELHEKHKWNKTQEGKIIFQEFLDTWTAVSLEMTPYTVFSLKFAEDTYNTYVVGRTGIYNLIDDGEFNIEDLYFMGRRMVLADKERQSFLDEWEYVLDSSVITSEELNNNNWEDFTNDQASEIDAALHEENNLLGQENLNRIWDNLIEEEEEIPRSYTSNEQILWPKYNTVYGIKNENDELTYKIYYIDGGWYDINFIGNSFDLAIAKVPVYGMINYQGTIVQQTFNN